MIKFYPENLVIQSTISASSVNQLFPLSNLKDPRRTKVFRSNSDSTRIIFDLQETSEIDSFLMVGDPRNGFGINDAILRLNATNEWSSPAFTQEIIFNEIHGVAYAEFDKQNFRFACLDLGSTLGYCEISNLFIGKMVTFENGMGINLGWSYADKELSTVKENRYGQKFIDVIARQRQLSFSISSMNKDEHDQVLEVYDRCGSTKPFWVRIGCDDMVNDKDRYAGMFFMPTIPPITNPSFGLYNISMTIEEAM